MNNFTFLTEEQCFEPFKKLEIFKKRGTIAPITDFSILLGGYVAMNDFYNNNYGSLENRSGYYWTSSRNKDNGNWTVVDLNGSCSYANVQNRHGGVRPVLSFSSIRDIVSNAVRANDGILEVEYGEYPQKVAPKSFQEMLEKAYNNGSSSIKKTGKTYTVDSKKLDRFHEQFSPRTIEEYVFENGKKYVRMKAISEDSSLFFVSDNECYKEDDYVWVEVSPIKWLIDEKNDIAVSESLLFSGLQFHHDKYSGDFIWSDIKYFMDKFFSKEIMPTVTKKVITEENSKPEKSISKDFIIFDNQFVITLEDILNGNYNINDIETLDLSQKYATIMWLTRVDTNNLVKARSFVQEMGPKYVTLFNSMWAQVYAEQQQKIENTEQVTTGKHI